MSRLAKFSIICIGLALPLNAAAQTDMTARERVLEYVTATTPLGSADEPVTASPLEALSDTLPAEEQAADSGVIKTAPDLSRDNASIDSTFETLSEAELENSIVRDLTKIERASSKKGPESFGFFTSAKDYLSQRGDKLQPRLTLRYDVTRKNAKTAVPGTSSVVDIIVGPDYAAISKTSSELVIYDFKEKRLLNINKANNSFTNASLYAAAYRAIDTVGKVTNGGKLRQLPLGENITLDAFYLESALGFADGPPLTELSVSQEEGKIVADFEGERVFSAMLKGPDLEDYRQAYSFISLLYHSEPVHPAILAELKDVRKAPNAMTLHSFGPTIPDGEIISWTLKSKISETAGFPLSSDLKSVIEQDNPSPLSFVMSEAVSGRALGGQVDPSLALTVIEQQIDQGSALSAWISAQSLKDMLGGCERLSGLCRAITTSGKAKIDDEELSNLMDALSKLETSSQRAEGLTALRDMASAADAPSLVLRRAGLALAKMSAAERDAAGFSDMDPAELLSQAIARNPYDGLAYQGLARVYAARGDFIQSWDINDAMRGLASAPKEWAKAINRAESQLETRAAGFFPPVNP